MARPVHLWAYGEEDIVALAGALLVGLGRNHPFVQGNKRTALTAAIVFLRFNGYAFVAPDGEPLGQFVEHSITGSIPERAFMNALRKCAITVEEWEEYQRVARSRRDP